MSARTFTCAMCDGVFEIEWTEEEARAELERYFPGKKAEDCDQVCDVCWEKIKPAPGRADQGPVSKMTLCGFPISAPPFEGPLSEEEQALINAAWASYTKATEDECP